MPRVSYFRAEDELFPKYIKNQNYLQNTPFINLVFHHEFEICFVMHRFYVFIIYQIFSLQRLNS